MRIYMELPLRIIIITETHTQNNMQMHYRNVEFVCVCEFYCKWLLIGWATGNGSAAVLNFTSFSHLLFPHMFNVPLSSHFFHLSCFSDLLESHDAFLHSSVKTHIYIVFHPLAHLHLFQSHLWKYADFLLLSHLHLAPLFSPSFFFLALPITHFLALPLFRPPSFPLIFLHFFWYFINMISPSAWDV